MEMQSEVQRCFSLRKRGSYLRNDFFGEGWIFWQFGLRLLSAGTELVSGSASQW